MTRAARMRGDGGRVGAAAPGPAGGGTRDQGIEALRIVAAFGIVAFHRGVAFREVAYAGLIVFVVLSPYVELRYRRDRPRTTAALVRSLLLPWAFWTIVYGLADIAEGKRAFPLNHGAWLPLLAGTSAHLWFLPFIFVVLLATRAVAQAGPAALAAALAAAAFPPALALAARWYPAAVAIGPPVGQWLQAAPAALAGIALGMAAHVGRRPAIGIGVLAAVIVAADIAGLPGLGTTYAVGLTATALVALIGEWMPQGRAILPLSSCMLGVYLTHALWLTVLNQMIGDHPLIIAILAFAAATAAVWLARRFVPLSRLVLG